MTAGDRAPVLLTYRALGLGDLLTALPALRALRRALPHHHHVLATSAWLAPLVGWIDAVDEHLPVRELAPLPPLGPIDVAVNLHGRGPQSHELLHAVPARAHIGFTPTPPPTPNPRVVRAAGAGSAPAVDWLPDAHEVTRWCRLLAAHDIPCDPADLGLVPPATPPSTHADHHGPSPGATVIHPGAKSIARRWPADRFAAIARDEVQRGRAVIVTGGPDEVDLAADVARRAGLPSRAVLAGATDVDQLARTVAAAGRVVCGDTGVAHLATALGTPSVILFGPVPPDLWGPPRDRRDRHRVIHNGLTGDPHGAQPDAGLLSITVPQVLHELRALDGEGQRMGRPPVTATLDPAM